MIKSFNLKQFPESMCEMEVEEVKQSSFQETAKAKGLAPQAQGTDAALEQLIKRSKKGIQTQVLI